MPFCLNCAASSQLPARRELHWEGEAALSFPAKPVGTVTLFPPAPIVTCSNHSLRLWPDLPEVRQPASHYVLDELARVQQILWVKEGLQAAHPFYGSPMFLGHKLSLH